MKFATTAGRQKHLLKESVTPMGQRDVYTHDTYGNVLTATRQRSGDNAFIQTTTAYTDDGNYTTSTTDARGNTVTQQVNPTDGTLTSVTDPNGQTVNYTYDDSKRVTSVQTTDGDKTYKNQYTYENDRIRTVSHNTTGENCDVTYTFDYDELGRKTTVKVGDQILSANVYTENRSGLLSEVQYGNGGKVKYAYDDYDRLTGVKYDEESEERYTYEYDASGNAVTVRDNYLGRVLQTECDLTDRPMGTQLRNADGSLIYRTELDYDTQNRLVGFGEETNGSTYKTNYTYDNDNRVTEIGFGGDDKVKYVYDNLGRVSSRTIEDGIDTGKFISTYTFVEGGHGTGSTTPLVAKIDQPQIPFEYEYDTRGNIVSEKRGDLTTTYTYDALGQLIRVNDPHENATWVYTYDCGGNITSKVKHAYTIGTLGTVLETIPYAYGDTNWKDKLTSYNGHPITYDAIGNPLNDGTWTYEWQAGRQLKQMSKPGTIVEFKYDHNGLRTQKKVNQNGVTTTTDYTCHGKLLTHMSVEDNILHFFYDAQSRPAKVSYNGTIYTYVHSLQGDIVGILDSSGTFVVEYKYDAWGKPLSTVGILSDTLGKFNPFRYRGYVYDEETALYYLQNRYYSVSAGRFINADTMIDLHSLGGMSLYHYCYNKPIIYHDPSGRAAIHLLIAAMTASLVMAIRSIATKKETVSTSTSTPYIPPQKARFDNAVLKNSNQVFIEDKEIIQKLKGAMTAYYDLKISYVYQMKDVPNKYYAGVTYISSQNRKMQGIATFEVMPASSTTWGDVFNAMTGVPSGLCRPAVANAWDCAQIGLDIGGAIPDIANTPITSEYILCTNVKSFPCKN